MVSLRAGADVVADGGEGGQGGQLTLRAGVQDADDISGNVRIAPVMSTVQGVAKVTVQGEERTDVAELGSTELDELKARSKAFQDAAAEAGTLDKVLNGRFEGARQTLQSAQVLQSTNDLSLGSAWNLTQLTTTAVTGGVVVQALNQAPVDLSIRTSGQLDIASSLSAGFVATPLPGTTQTKAEANKTIDAALAVGATNLPIGAGSGITLVAGADLNSASVDATQSDSTASVRIGDPNGESSVFVRSTTGDIRVVAAGDVVLVNDQATVYTTGRLATAEETAGALGFEKGSSGNTKHIDLITRGSNRDTTRQTPFMLDGGSIDIVAGGSLRTETINQFGFVSDWTFNKSDVKAEKSQAWWSRYDLFNQGVATFGGGDIVVRAGDDIVNTGVVTATSGYKDAKGVVHRFGGGNVTVQADRNIAGFMTKVGGSKAHISAGLNMEGSTERGASLLMYEDTAMVVRANQDMLIDRVTDAGIHNKGGGTEDRSRSIGIFGLGRDGSIVMQSVSGDVLINDVAPTKVDGDRGSASLLPAVSTITAPQGDIRASVVNQMPQSDGATLSMLAAGDLEVEQINIFAGSSFGEGVVWPGGLDVGAVLRSAQGNVFGTTVAQLETGRRAPVQLVAQTGNVELKGEIADAVRIVAGTDVNIPALRVQHQGSNELSWIQAGRDINLDSPAAQLAIRGPGDAVVVAGRDVQNSMADGIQATGNRENGKLPDGSASITVLAGVNPTQGDYTQAQASYFHLLGGAGVADWASDLFAQLEALQSGQALPELGSTQAQAFAQMGFTQQLDAAKALVGEPAFQQAVLSWMQGREANPALGSSQALSMLASLPAREQSALIGAVLAPTWTTRLSGEQQRTVALAMNAERGGVHDAKLIAYVARRTGAKAEGMDVATAMDLFAQSPQITPEQRLLFVNQVLEGELLASGLAAKEQTSRDLKLDAYQRGFNALATVFPGSKTTASVLMGSSSIKTQQDSDIHIFTPHGGLNVGRLTGAASSETAAKLGIVTTSGGDINSVVRDSIEVNQSRIFVVEDGNMLLWATRGNIDAGKGSKTVTGAPAPVFRIVNGALQVDTTGSFSGSGIAALDAQSELNLFAPRGEINAGEAGIRAGGKINLDAVTVVGANDIQVAGGGNLAPPPAVGNAATDVGSLGQSATAAGPADDDNKKKEAATPKRRLLLDLLGFGDTDADDEDERKKKKAE
jgi:Filamentous haemagglutinin family outer membrane protein